MLYIQSLHVLKKIQQHFYEKKNPKIPTLQLKSAFQPNTAQLYFVKLKITTEGQFKNSNKRKNN